VSDPEELLRRHYQEVFNAHHAMLQARRRQDPDFTLESLQAFLKDAYVQAENDWLGRGMLFETTQAAIIAAHEAVLAEWLAEEQEKEAP